MAPAGNKVELSILDLGRVREGSDRRTALDDARELARHAEGLGYQRFWLAEHHNMPGVSTAATAIVIAHVEKRGQRTFPFETKLFSDPFSA